MEIRHLKKIPLEKFYNRDSISDFNFYKMPKSLWGNSTYKGLSIGAKSMYMIMRDRQDLSIKNNWFDDSGNVYFVFDCDNLALLMEVSTSTVNRYKKELIDYELLYQRRMGQGRPNMLYILRPESVAITLNSDNDISRKAKNATLEKRKSLCSKTELSETERARLIYLHPQSGDVLNRDELIDLIEYYTQKRFDKPLRETTGYPDLEIYQSYNGYEIIEILEKNIKNYNQCNLDYLSTIQERFK